MSKHKPRYCETCGKSIRRNGRNGPAWNDVHYCCIACTPMTKRVPVTIYCRHCKAPIPRRGAAEKEYVKRIYCSRECKGAALSTEMNMTTCDCGQPSTQTLWVLQLNGSGTYIDTPLHLCDACAALVDNASTEPREYDDTRPCFGWRTGERGYHHTAGWTFRRSYQE